MQRIARPTFARFVRAATVSIQDEEHFETLTGKGKAVVQFTAKWCGPCQGIKPSIQKLSDTETDVAFLVVDVDEVPELAEAHRVTQIPFFVGLNNGTQVGQFSGANISGVEDLANQVKSA
eukprot:Rhum_TRINITY_DN24845_c0_g1::Rhum_TRINITY_DN24845_c0_g1_i1::g.180216::m.180216/K03671/trxA; thioredoxin 1